MMKLDLKAVRLSGTVLKLGQLSQPDALVLQVGQSLASVSWKRLRTSFVRAPLVVGAPGDATVIAEDVAVDSAWTIDEKSQQVALARAGEILFIDPLARRVVRTAPVKGLRNGTFDMALDGDGKRALVVVVRDVALDFSEYAVVAVDLATGDLTPESSIHANADLELLWDDMSRAWLIGDTHTGALWRWDGTKPATRFAGPADATIQAATLAATAEGAVATALLQTATGAGRLVAGRVGAAGVTWSQPLDLPGAAVLTARRHPTQALWACLAHDDAGQQIQVRGADGKVAAAAPLLPPFLMSKLFWSTAEPTRIWGVGMRALAAGTLGEEEESVAP